MYIIHIRWTLKLFSWVLIQELRWLHNTFAYIIALLFSQVKPRSWKIILVKICMDCEVCWTAKTYASKFFHRVNQISRRLEPVKLSSPPSLLAHPYELLRDSTLRPTRTMSTCYSNSSRCSYPAFTESLYYWNKEIITRSYKQIMYQRVIHYWFEVNIPVYVHTCEKRCSYSH